MTRKCQSTGGGAWDRTGELRKICKFGGLGILNVLESEKDFGDVTYWRVWIWSKKVLCMLLCHGCRYRCLTDKSYDFSLKFYVLVLI